MLYRLWFLQAQSSGLSNPYGFYFLGTSLLDNQILTFPCGLPLLKSVFSSTANVLCNLRLLCQKLSWFLGKGGTDSFHNCFKKGRPLSQSFG